MTEFRIKQWSLAGQDPDGALGFMTPGGHLAFIVGTRPEAIKIAPLLLCLIEERSSEGASISTGQHDQLVDELLAIFGAPATHHLRIQRRHGSVNEVASGVFEHLPELLDDLSPRFLAVQGDTTSAMAAAIAAYNMAIPVAHIEAGLRSGDLSSPFPEEGNRRLISSVATLHLAPTKRARHNLITEGIDPGKIVITGNTVIDALRWALSSGKQAPDAWVLGSVPPTRHLVLATTHRRESWGQPLQGTIDGLEALAKQDAGTHILLPVHPNPRVRDPIQARLGNLDNVTLCEPLSYLTMCQALARASVVVTDSGGLQEEAPSLGVPVVVLRETTERPEAVETGWAELVGTEPELIVRATTRRLDQAASASRLPGTVSSGPFGDGNAARRCLDAIRWALDEGPRPSDFVAPTGGAGGTVTPDPDVHIGPPAST